MLMIHNGYIALAPNNLLQSGELVNRCIEDLNLWMLHNVLLLNPAKTEAIKLIFASQQEMLNALTQTR